MAHVTSGFSFAFLQECFVATLLILARGETGMAEQSDDDLDDYELWRAFKQQADILRKEVEGQKKGRSQLLEWCEGASTSDHPVPSSTTGVQCAHCAHGCTSRNEGQSQTQLRLPNLQHLQVKEEPLPDLPVAFRKKAYINSAAWEYK